MYINIFLILTSLAIVILDLKYNKIFNMVAYPLMVVGIIINIAIFGPIGIAYSLIGFALGLCACFIPYKLRASGLGEFKLMALIGIIKGYHFVIISSLIAYIITLACQTFNLYIVGNLKDLIANSKMYIALVLQYGISISTIIEENVGITFIPYTLIVFIGVLAGLLI